MPHLKRTIPTTYAATTGGRTRSWMWLAIGVVLVIVTGVAALTFAAPRSRSATDSQAGAQIGGDLHTVFFNAGTLYVGGHDAVVTSTDSGQHLRPITSLTGADAMGWAASGSSLLVGGHPGLFRSVDQGTTFTKVTAPVSDVHALGGAGTMLYLGSPQAGLLASEDGGRTWDLRTARQGQDFMGTILVDPKNPSRALAPDMATGLMRTVDGGRTWYPAGGPVGALAAAWNPADTRQLVVVGMTGAAASRNGGATWQPLSVPAGTSAVTFGPGGTVLAGVLRDQRAVIYASKDQGKSWSGTAKSASHTGG
ncbi:hypothetical protein HJ588_15885 [Flexivirga sp. ID2601S]|uniref:Exo-alpha-sialidase n=1 Tax=Flexivirga aerilata TaxID=1656889 RepID=A0A849AK06_9MICO|nr:MULTISPECIES: hypothetical protein [Flexivirga]NNG40745.1 hypothetical protein [Flexivirga aerilata]